MNTGELIRQKRLEKGLTTTEVGAKIGVSHATIVRWESGKIGSIKNDKIAAIARVLGVSPLELLDTPTDKELSIIDKLRFLSQQDREEIEAMVNFKFERAVKK